MVVVCESDNGVFEAGGRSKARDTETSDDKGLRDALQILSICSRQELNVLTKMIGSIVFNATYA
jgi:hypothetical protein